MLNRRIRKILVTLAVSLGIMSFTSGCGLLKKDRETEPETQSETMTEETESETETEPQTELKKDIAYTSTDKTIRITLPDSTWAVTQDVDEMRVFSSGTDAMISIVHAANASEMRNLAVSVSEEELKASLTSQYTEANSFEVLDFEKLSSATIDTYEYVVKYNSTSMWAYVITYGIIADEQAYVITGTVTDDNKVLMEAVKKAVESFTVLRNSAFTAMPGTVVNNNQSESQPQSETKNTTVDEELDKLTDYGTAATLYANDVVNIRLQPSTESNDNIIGSLNAGDQVTVVGETPQWFKVNIQGNIGYINKAFLVSTKPTQTEAPKQDNEDEGNSSNQVSNSTITNTELDSYIDYGTSYTFYSNSSEVNLRAQPGTDSTIVGSLSNGQAVSVIGETDNWFVVYVNGMTGYVSKAYISSSSTGNTGSTGGDGGSGSGSGQGTTSTTGVLSGTVTGATGDTITIQGDDGNIYYIDYSDASLSTNDGLNAGTYITATIDYTNTAPNGTLYATSVSGH